ncbi:MAG: Dyp-type peroxidase [Alphaproteobacteria bacterium]
MSTHQPGILPPIPGHGRYLEFGARPGQDPRAALAELASIELDESTVVGIGPGLVRGLGHKIDGLGAFPSLSGPGCEVPSTQAALWIWVRGGDRGHILHQARALARVVDPAFRCERLVDGFKYGAGLDLTGYEDGTENPEGEEALAAAFVEGAGPALDGSSFVAVQQWVHDLDRFAGKPQGERDNIIGRRRSDNEELADAPETAHVKRTEQESFDPPAFVLRRSMPWADAAGGGRGGEGLMFVAFGKSFDAFEAQLRRMAGQEDGKIDALFDFTRPISGSYFWCPPLAGGKLKLAAIGL